MITAFAQGLRVAGATWRWWWPCPCVVLMAAVRAAGATDALSGASMGFVRRRLGLGGFGAAVRAQTAVTVKAVSSRPPPCGAWGTPVAQWPAGPQRSVSDAPGVEKIEQETGGPFGICRGTLSTEPAKGRPGRSFLDE